MADPGLLIDCPRVRLHVLELPRHIRSRPPERLRRRVHGYYRHVPTSVAVPRIRHARSVAECTKPSVDHERLRQRRTVPKRPHAHDSTGNSPGAIANPFSEHVLRPSFPRSNAGQDPDKSAGGPNDPDTKPPAVVAETHSRGASGSNLADHLGATSRNKSTSRRTPTIHRASVRPLTSPKHRSHHDMTPRREPCGPSRHRHRQHRHRIPSRHLTLRRPTETGGSHQRGRTARAVALEEREPCGWGSSFNATARAVRPVASPLPSTPPPKPVSPPHSSPPDRDGWQPSARPHGSRRCVRREGAVRLGLVRKRHGASRAARRVTVTVNAAAEARLATSLFAARPRRVAAINEAARLAPLR